MTTTNDETYKIGYDEPYKNINEGNKIELGDQLNEELDYRKISSHLGMDEEMKKFQNRPNRGYEILSAWSKKNSAGTVRVLIQTLKLIDRKDLAEKVEDFRNDYMFLTLVMYGEDTKPINVNVKTPSRKLLIDVVRPEVIKNFQSYLTGKNQIVMTIDGHDPPWSEPCSNFKGRQVNVRIKKPCKALDGSVYQNKNSGKDLGPRNVMTAIKNIDNLTISDPTNSAYDNLNPDKHHLSHLPGFFDYDRGQTEIKLREVPERKYILRYRRNLTSEHDSHMILSFRHNSVMWHFLILKRSTEDMQFYLFNDGHFASSVTELLAYYEKNRVSSTTAVCPDCFLDGPAI